MDNFTIDDILKRFPLCLRENILELWTNTNIGVSSMNMKINLLPKKLKYDYNLNTGNSFILEIPYAGKRLQWEILFNDEDHMFAPDFDFINETFLFDPDLQTIQNNIPSLLEWNVMNSKSLISIIQELLVLYKKHQLEKLDAEPKFARFKSEYVLLKHELNMSDEDIEVYTDNDSVHFLIGLKLDFTSLPVYIQKSYFEEEQDLLNPGKDSATLRISFGFNRVTSYLQLSPRLEYVLGDYTTLHIPTYKKDDSIVEYVTTMLKLLENKIEQIKDHFNLREEYISGLLALHGPNIIEYDNIDFSKAMFLFEVDNFYCLVHIMLSNRFPLEKPIINLRSVYYRTNGKPTCTEIDIYPYSPRWKPEEMVKRLSVCLFEEIHKLKNSCTNKS